jgi:PEP-CTERM motif-containing protein
MDDFLYGEPQPIPEPSTLALFGIGVVALFGVQRYRKMQRARLG